MKKRINNKPQRLISEYLFNKWQELKREGDGKNIAKIIGKSGPYVSQALKYGCISNEKHIDKINQYFIERSQRQKESERKLLSIGENLA